jgi:hypothetical protein
MTMTIIATYTAHNVQELTELVDMIRAGEPTELEINGLLSFDYTDLDATPPHGIDRPYWATDKAMSKAVAHYTAALVAWTREHITEGPLMNVSDAVLREAYYEMQAFGYDTRLDGVTDEQAQCIRGAFRDATAGMVPL